MKQLLVFLVVLGWTGLTSADAVIDWNETAAIAAGLSTVNPLHESRLLATMHAAIHDALNAIERRFQPYAFDAQAAAGASPEAAVATAAHDVLLALFSQLPESLFPPAAIAAVTDFVEAAYAAALAAIPDGPGKNEGIHIGRGAAFVHEILPSGRRKRQLACLRGVSLPARRDGGD